MYFILNWDKIMFCSHDGAALILNAGGAVKPVASATNLPKQYSLI